MNAITVSNLIYDVPRKRVLNNVNLEIRKGEIISVMGMSGSGKTTLLKLLTGLLRPSSGQILIEDTDITKLTESELDQVRLKMGLVFQYAALFDSLTIYDNIVFGVVRHRKHVTRQELDTLVHTRLEQVQLKDVETLFPAQLSGGMQKRVGLARALAMDPTLVFYDEPTSGLDPVTANTIDELILATRQRMDVTSVVVSHHLPSIFRISDRVAMLHQGEIVIYGTPGEVQASPDPVVQTFLHPERYQQGGSPIAKE
jgi:phospholipid/cholesterol/gamma-HCH transport system ATP-binding protein